MAGGATDAERIGPSMHEGVQLLAGHVFGQNLQVGGRGHVHVVVRRRSAWGRWRALRRLRGSGEGEDGREEHDCRGGGLGQGNWLQGGRSPDGCGGIFLTDGILPKKDALAG
jgi:hypothetical protein